MKYTAKVCRLSNKFYSDYPGTSYPELLLKPSRPYTCLLIETKADYFICIPFRSNITHKDAFLFRGTHRSSHSRSGLDYKKIVIIRNKNYIDSVGSAIVDNDEYLAMLSNIEKIINEVTSYIEKYINHMNKSSVLHQREFTRHYQYSTLQYFHDELNIKPINT